MPLTLNDWLELLESRHPKSIELGLQRCSEVWKRMGSPQPSARIFTVAGTNGKGSTVAYLCGMLQEFGYSFGCYTTPHLLSYNERIQINGTNCDDEQLIAAFERIEAVRGDISLTYFEFGTLAAISIMSMEKLDFAVMEVGLGGRLDAVNILNADCTVVTPIGLDHQEYLGPDREGIGREKAGIFRPGVPVICGEPHPPASVLDRAAALGAPLRRLAHDFEVIPEGTGLRFRTGERAFLLPSPVMRGEHQVNNMATAVAAFLELLPAAGNSVELLSRGLQKVTLAGRMQQLSERPQIWVDVGHNPLAAEVIAQVLAKTLEDRPGGICHCVIGMLADKDAASVAERLGTLVSSWYCVGLPGPRGQTGRQLAGLIKPVLEHNRISTCDDVASALERVLDVCLPADCVLVFGSFLTASGAIAWWQQFESAPAKRSFPKTPGVCAL